MTPGAPPGSPAPVVAIVGWRKSGKTTLVERLVRILTDRGLNVATVKHAHHSFDIDHPGTDSARHRAAGARQVAIVSRARVAMIAEHGGREPPLSGVLARLGPCDLVLIEGYKREPVPKIELRRGDALRDEPLDPADTHVIAIASDHEPDPAGVPVLDLNDPERIADFILENVAGIVTKERSSG